MKRALLVHPDAEVVFFLGDGLAEVDSLASEEVSRAWFAVRGNCDCYPTFRSVDVNKTETVKLCGYTITFTHGDLYDAKYTSERLLLLAERTDADILLFGHTHTPFCEYITDREKPFCLFNPGSVGQGTGCYGIITLGEKPSFSHFKLI
jgi:putative phosphoesterase